MDLWIKFDSYNVDEEIRDYAVTGYTAYTGSLDITKKFYDGAPVREATESEVKAQTYGMLGLAPAKVKAIADMKAECTSLKEATYPIGLQLDNEARGKKTDYMAMRYFLEDYNDQRDTHETNINAKTTTQQIADYDVSWTTP